MTAELTQEVSRRLASDRYGWLTTVAKSGQPVPRLVAFCALTTSPGARTVYDQRRVADDTHHQALRALGNRLVGILHGCLRPPQHLQRTHRLGTPPTRRGATPYDRGMSSQVPFAINHTWPSQAAFTWGEVFGYHIDHLPLVEEFSEHA